MGCLLWGVEDNLRVHSGTDQPERSNPRTGGPGVTLDIVDIGRSHRPPMLGFDAY